MQIYITDVPCMLMSQHARIWGVNVPTSGSLWAYPPGPSRDPFQGPSGDSLPTSQGLMGLTWGHTGASQWSAKDLEAPKRTAWGRPGPCGAVTSLCISIPEVLIDIAYIPCMAMSLGAPCMYLDTLHDFL